MPDHRTRRGDLPEFLSSHDPVADLYASFGCVTEEEAIGDGLASARRCSKDRPKGHPSSDNRPDRDF